MPSKSAKNTFGFEERAAAAASNSGAICLQCPHQGAYTLSKTYFSLFKIASLKFFPTIVLTGPFSSVGIGADFKKG